MIAILFVCAGTKEKTKMEEKRQREVRAWSKRKFTNL